jgi:hypothetical protein
MIVIFRPLVGVAFFYSKVNKTSFYYCYSFNTTPCFADPPPMGNKSIEAENSPPLEPSTLA